MRRRKCDENDREREKSGEKEGSSVPSSIHASPSQSNDRHCLIADPFYQIELVTRERELVAHCRKSKLLIEEIRQNVHLISMKKGYLSSKTRT